MIILASSVSWHDDLFSHLCKDPSNLWKMVKTKEQLVTVIEKFGHLIDRIYFPHWSYMIPEEIFLRYECVVFHMTDLPFGRGGSPLQNLIVRGFEKTKISAFRVSYGVDTGPIYLKKSLDLSGSAREIYLRAGSIICDMIKEIETDKPVPSEQSGEVVTFSRRSPEQSEIPMGLSGRELYNFIRMLDADGYPAAFLRSGGLKVELTNARIVGGEVFAESKLVFCDDD